MENGYDESLLQCIKEIDEAREDGTLKVVALSVNSTEEGRRKLLDCLGEAQSLTEHEVDRPLQHIIRATAADLREHRVEVAKREK